MIATIGERTAHGAVRVAADSASVALAPIDAALDVLDGALDGLTIEAFTPLALRRAGERARRARARIDRFDAALAARARALTVAGAVKDATSVLDPEGRRPMGDVTAATRRAEALSDAPVLQGAFDDGQLPAAHLDLVARARRQLTGTRRRAFEAAHERLVAAARRQSLADFRRTLASVIDEIDAAHGAGDVERLRRQRSLRRWWDRDGLRHWHLAVDPEAGARLDGALDAQIEALFHRDRDANGGEVRRSSEQLACDALGDLVAGGHAAKRPGRAEIIVHVDHDTLRDGLHSRSIHHDNNGQPLTPAAIRRLACDAGIIPVLLGGDTIPLDVGRESRTATPDQRRALAAVYDDCAITGCGVPYAHCQVHHTVEWNDHGFTDLEVLVPICGKHHHLVHDHHWRMSLDPHRVLRLYRPDGTLDSIHHPVGRHPPPRSP
ncbi:MAG: DUF222 domain-containing protein [Acidimicrobiia bacterium]|nr:DUF222 domain-containing protein [Acidimicrobiia bacterium]